MQPANFNPDPVTSKPALRLRTSDAVGQPLGSDAAGQGHGIGLHHPYFQSGGSTSHLSLVGQASGSSCPPASVQSDIRQPTYHHQQDSYQGGSPRTKQLLDSLEWGMQPSQMQASQLQRMLDQQALLEQLQSQLNQQAQIGSAQQSALPPLLQSQLQSAAGLNADNPVALSAEPGFAQSMSSLTGHWPSHPRSPPTVPSNVSSPALSDLQGTSGLKHGVYAVHEEKKHSRAHGSTHSTKSRQLDGEVGQVATTEKLRREIARLHADQERLEKEIARQKALRETERMEFTDAKDRLKHSWAADREDFARVKSSLKNKNAEHHAQSGRLSQQLKELDGVNRGLRDLCARNGISVPAELEVSHSRHHAGLGPHSSGSAPSNPMSVSSSSGMSTCASTVPSSQLSAAAARDLPQPQLPPGDPAYDSDHTERGGARGQWASGRNASTSTPHQPSWDADTIMSMVQQLPKLVQRQDQGEDTESAAEATEGPTATSAATQAAAALEQLAAALKGSQTNVKAATPGSQSPMPLARSLSPTIEEEEDCEEMSAAEEGGSRDLNRMSLQSWVSREDSSHAPADSRPAPGAPPGPESSRSDSDGFRLEFPKVAEKRETSPFERLAHGHPHP